MVEIDTHQSQEKEKRNLCEVLAVGIGGRDREQALIRRIVVIAVQQLCIDECAM